MADRWIRRLGNRLEGEEPPAGLWERARRADVPAAPEAPPMSSRLTAALVALAIVAGIALGGWVLLGPARDLARVADDVPGPVVGPSPTVSTRPEISDGGVTLDCPQEEQIDFTYAGNSILQPAGAAIIRVNLAGIRGTDTLEQVNIDRTGATRWEGVWRVVRDGSVIARILVPELSGVACAGSGITGAAPTRGDEVAIYFPTHLRPPTGSPEAGNTATIIVRSNCLLLRSVYDDGTVDVRMAIWPHGWKLAEGTVILDADGTPVAAVGDTVFMGGGEVSSEVVLRVVGEPPPPRCEFGGFWWVTPPLERLQS